MKAGEVVLQELLNGKVQYRVPLFQRTYSWREKDWERLWTDIREIYRLQEPRSHFLGALVTLPLPDSPENTNKYMLIDGQQRLTTLFILLSSLRDRARNSDELATLAEQIDEECLLNKFARHPEEKLKLLPTQADRAHYEAIVSGQGDGKSRIADAKEYFDVVLSETDDNEAPFDLARLKSCITDYLALVSIRLDQDDSPYRIFESLNNTGMALSDADLIRNDIFMRIPSPDDQHVAYDRHWLPMQQRMEEDNRSWLTDFFWRYAMVDGDEPRYDEVYQAIRADIEKGLEAGRTALDLLREFDHFSALYLMIWRPDRGGEQDSEVAVRAARLQQWEVDVAYPFLLNAYDLRYQGAISSQQLATVLGMVESFVVRRLVCGVPTNRLRNIFAKMSAQVQGSDYVTNCADYLMRSTWPSDALFRDRFQTFRIYGTRLNRTRLILSSLEQSFKHHEPVDMTDVTIEHLMPQRPSPEWQEVLGADWRTIHEEYLHTIGNLTYSGYNAEMGNLPFEQKKAILSKSHFELNRDVVQQVRWTATEIRQRAELLADRALSIWSR